MAAPNHLRPKTKQTVAEVLDALGLPKPTSNYDWCFGKAAETAVMFQWFDQLKDFGGAVGFIESSEQWAQDNADVAETVQLNRAWKVHSLVLNAFMSKRPIHVAIVDGVSKFIPVNDTTGRTKETGQAKYRTLDDELWWPHHRDPATRQIVVLRGIKQPDNYDPLSDTFLSHNQAASPSIEVEPLAQLRASKTVIYDRDNGVVREAKERAYEGRCEFCREVGFETDPDKFYLEAHHVIPISQGGPDAVWNIAVLCANDHRRAHFGVDRVEMRNHLVNMLGNLYPDHRARLVELAVAR